MKVLVFIDPSSSLYYYNELDSYYFYSFGENYVSAKNAVRVANRDSMIIAPEDNVKRLEFVCVLEV